MLLWIFPVGMQLSMVFLIDNVAIILDLYLAVFIVIDSLIAVTFDNPLAQDFDGLDSNLPFTSSLFDGLKKLDRVFGAAVLNEGDHVTQNRELAVVVDTEVDIFSQNSPLDLSLHEDRESASLPKEVDHRTFSS